jgi:hypothetical protein
VRVPTTKIVNNQSKRGFCFINTCDLTEDHQVYVEPDLVEPGLVLDDSKNPHKINSANWYKFELDLAGVNFASNSSKFELSELYKEIAE